MIIAGLFFAPLLYRMNLLTIGDYYRARYNRVVELIMTMCIMISYLGWVSAQVMALGLVFNLVSGGAHRPIDRDDDWYGDRADLHHVRRYVVGGAAGFRADDGHHGWYVADRGAGEW